MTNPFDVSAYARQHRDRLTAAAVRASIPPEQSFTRFIGNNAATIKDMLDALDGPNQANFYLAFDQPGNLIPRQFLTALSNAPHMRPAALPGHQPDATLLSFLLSGPRLMTAQTVRNVFEAHPNITRFSINVAEVLELLSRAPQTRQRLHEMLTRFDPALHDEIFVGLEKEYPPQLAGFKNFVERFAPEPGQENPLRFKLSLADSENHRTLVCDLVSPAIEKEFNVQNPHATQALFNAGIIEADGNNTCRVVVLPSPIKTLDHFDFVRKLRYPAWQAPGVVDEAIEAWVKESHRLAKPLDNRLTQRLASLHAESQNARLREAAMAEAAAEEGAAEAVVEAQAMTSNDGMPPL